MKEFHFQTTPVEVEHIDNGITFDIIVTLTRGTDTSMVRIANYHTNGYILKRTEKSSGYPGEW